eukprot:SAG31_NODE_3986_length_3684_cov_3.991074_1_plen_169_part_00
MEAVPSWNTYSSLHLPVPATTSFQDEWLEGSVRPTLHNTPYTSAHGTIMGGKVASSFHPFGLGARTPPSPSGSKFSYGETPSTLASPGGVDAAESAAAADRAIATQTKARLAAQAAELRYLEQAREAEEQVAIVNRQIDFARAAAETAISRAKQQANAREAAEARLLW